MTVADDKVTQLPLPLERIGRRIDSAWQRIQKGEAEWIDGSLEAAQSLYDGRNAPEHKAEQAFNKWLANNNHDHWNDQDRAALINLASDMRLARTVLAETTRRSYQHIWNEVKDRFSHVRKADKPQRGRPKGSRRSAPQPHYKATEIAALDQQGKSYDEIAAETGVGPRQVRHVAERDRIRRETLDELLGAVAAEQFSEKGKLRIEDAIRIHINRLNKQFEQRVNAEVRRRIDAANDAMRANYKKLHLENINLRRIVGERGVFTRAQFRQMQMLCHPDSSASERTKAELSQILVENEVRLVKADK